MRNEKTHSMLLALVGGYMLYLAYQLLDKYHAGTKEMPDAVFFVAIPVFAAAGIGTLLWALRIYRTQRKEEQEKREEPGTEREKAETEREK